MKKRNFFFIINQLNKHGVSRRWFTENDVKHLRSGALRIITNIAEKENTFYGKLKKEFLHRCISKILFIDIEQLSKM